MEKEYDFEGVGKKMPYTVPDDFFAKMQAHVLAEVEKEEKAKQRHHSKLVRMYVSVASIAACVCLGCFIGYSLMSNSVAGSSMTQDGMRQETISGVASVDKAYDKLSSDEQQELSATYANDVYLSME